MESKRLLIPFIMGALTVSACDTIPLPGVGANMRASGGTLQSDVEIFEGTTFTATWRSSPQTIIRLAYEATTPVTDLEAIEIAERLSGCKAVGSGIETNLIGGLASVRIPATCNSSNDSKSATS